MADTDIPLTFEQQVILRLTEVVENQQEVSRRLTEISASAVKANKSLERYEQTVRSVSKAKEKLYKISYTVGRNLRRVFDTSIVAVSSVLGILVKSIEQTGQGLYDFERASNSAGRAAERLITTFNKVSGSSNASVIAVQDVAKALTGYATTVSRKVLIANDQFQAGYTSLLGTLSHGIGSEAATEMINRLLDATDDYRILTKDTITQLGGLQEAVDNAYTVQTPEANEKAIRQLQEATKTMENLAALAGDEGGYDLLKQLRVQMDTLQKAQHGGILAVTSLADASSRLRKIFKDLQASMLDAFGTEFARAIQQVSIMVSQQLTPKIKQLAERFKAWGGAEKVVTMLRAAYDKLRIALQQIIPFFGKLWDLLKYIINTVKKFYDQWPKLTLAVGAFLIAVGPLKTLGLVFTGAVKGVSALGRAFLGAQKNAGELCAAVECGPLQQFFSPRGMKGMYGRGGLGLGGAVAGTGGAIVGGVVGGAVGHFGGKAVARGLGAGEFGGAEGVAGVVGATAGATALGGPLAGAIAAVASAILSVAQALRETSKESKKLDEATEILSSSTQSYAQSVQASASKAVTPYQQARQNVKELEAQLMELESNTPKATVISAPFGIFGLEIELFKKKIVKYNSKVDELREKIAEARQTQDDFHTGVPEIDPASSEKINELQQTRNNLVQQGLVATEEQRKKILEQVQAIEKQIEQENAIGKLNSERKMYEQQIKDLQTSSQGYNIDIKIKDEALKQISELENKKIQIDANIKSIKTEDIEKRYKELQEQKDKLNEKIEGLDPKDSAGVKRLTEESKKLKEETNKFNDAAKKSNDLTAEQKERFDQLGSGTDDALKRLEEFSATLGDMAQYLAIIENTSKAMSGLSAAIMTLGPNAELAGQSLAKTLGENIQTTIQSARDALLEANKTFAAAFAYKDPKVRAEKIAEATEKIKQATEGVKQAHEELTRLDAVRLDRTERQRKVMEANLRISQATYGTAALAVEAQLQVVKYRAQEVRHMQNMLASQKNQLAAYDQQIAEAQAQGKNEEEINTLRGLRFDLENKTLDTMERMKSAQADMLDQVKQLRDGYLDAVQAQAFGAGKFEKILITQDQNLLKGLEKRVAKENFLLGQIGNAASEANTRAQQFGVGGYGQMTDPVTGQPLSQGELRENERAYTSNITDPHTRALVEQTQNIVYSAFNGLDQSIGSQIGATEANTQASNNVADAFNRAVEKGYLATGGVAGLPPGAPPTQTAAGQAAADAMRGLGGGIANGVVGAIKTFFNARGGEAGNTPVPEMEGILQAQDYADPTGRKTKKTPLQKAIDQVNKTQNSLNKVNQRMEQFKQGQSPALDAQGFDARTVDEINKQRKQSSAQLSSLEKRKRGLENQLGRDKGHALVEAQGLPTAESEIAKQGQGSLDRAGKSSWTGLLQQAFGGDPNRQGALKKLTHGKSSGQGWAAQIDAATNVFKAFAAFIDSWHNEDQGSDVTSTRQTVPTGRTSLGTKG